LDEGREGLDTPAQPGLTIGPRLRYREDRVGGAGQQRRRPIDDPLVVGLDSSARSTRGPPANTDGKATAGTPKCDSIASPAPTSIDTRAAASEPAGSVHAQSKPAILAAGNRSA
jgi:hypothetical protein